MANNGLNESCNNSISKINACVVLIESDPDAIKLLGHIFARAPITIEINTRPNDRMALDYLEGAYEKGHLDNICLILLGESMPIANGQEFLRILRSDDRYKHIPVVALAADSQIELMQEAYRDTTNDIISKINMLEGMTNAVDIVVRSWFQTARESYMK